MCNTSGMLNELWYIYLMGFCVAINTIKDSLMKSKMYKAYIYIIWPYSGRIYTIVLKASVSIEELSLSVLLMFVIFSKFYIMNIYYFIKGDKKTWEVLQTLAIRFLSLPHNLQPACRSMLDWQVLLTVFLFSHHLLTPVWTSSWNPEPYQDRANFLKLKFKWNKNFRNFSNIVKDPHFHSF